MKLRKEELKIEKLAVDSVREYWRNHMKMKKKKEPSIGEIERWYHSLWDTDRDLYMLIARIIWSFKRWSERT